jgi:periplasmic divalent cation tolerance protein
VVYIPSAVKAIVIVTTVGTEEQANLVAEELVVSKSASCVNILPVHRSVYRWQGKVCEDSEFLLVIKSAEEKYEAVEKTIQELHDYELPEILAFNIARGEKGFLEWISDCLSGTVDPEEEVVMERGHEG